MDQTDDVSKKVGSEGDGGGGSDAERVISAGSEYTRSNRGKLSFFNMIP